MTSHLFWTGEALAGILILVLLVSLFGPEGTGRAAQQRDDERSQTRVSYHRPTPVFDHPGASQPLAVGAASVTTITTPFGNEIEWP